MIFSGFQIKNFRSVGEEALTFNPLKKCNILVGQNNVGKSNVIKAIKLISDFFRNRGEKSITLQHLDTFNRIKDKPFTFKLFFKTNNDSEIDKVVEAATGEDTIWFEYSWVESGKPYMINHSLTDLKNMNLASKVFDSFSGYSFNQQPSKEQLKSNFMKDEHKRRFFEKVQHLIPNVEIIPEFRKMQMGGSFGYDGQNLIQTLQEYKNPIIGNDNKQVKFHRIEKLIRKLINEPDAELEISFPQQELIINNGRLRLPINSYGTGVHELIILISSIVIIENSICSIEEPEIHFHPRLQREFIDFLASETDNQFLISTHSPILINALGTGKAIQLFHLRKIDEITRSNTISNENDLLNAFNDLGIKPSDILQSNFVIWVEGSSDANYLQKWIELLEPSLIEGKHYNFIMYRNLYKLTADNQEIDHNFMNILHISRNSFLILDSDIANKNEELSADKKRIVKECETNNIKYWLTDGREIENYLSQSVISKTLSKLNRKALKVEIDPYEKFGEKIDSELKKADEKILDYSNQKRYLSKKIANNFSLDDFSEKLKSRMNELISEIKKLNT